MTIPRRVDLSEPQYLQSGGINPFSFASVCFSINSLILETYTYHIAIPFGYVVERNYLSNGRQREDRSCFFSYRVMATG